jgi:hypothetical protein
MYHSPCTVVVYQGSWPELVASSSGLSIRTWFDFDLSRLQSGVEDIRKTDECDAADRGAISTRSLVLHVNG